MSNRRAARHYAKDCVKRSGLTPGQRYFLSVCDEAVVRVAYRGRGSARNGILMAMHRIDPSGKYRHLPQWSACMKRGLVVVPGKKNAYAVTEGDRFRLTPLGLSALCNGLVM